MGEFPSVPGVELRPIPGVIGYAAGSDGRIYTFRRPGVIRGRHPAYTRSPRRLKGFLNKRGYFCVLIYWRGKATRTVHRLIAEAFHGPCPEGLECSHLNGDSRDNTPGNLAWESSEDNRRRRADGGGPSLPGERNGAAKLTEGDVLAIRREALRGESKASLSRRFCVSESTIRNVVTRRKWKHV